jgi:uncharacterized membrane protein YcjF (UPF0283 family)
VEVAALLGGTASGGVTTVICALLAHQWVTPIANLGDWLGLAIFLTTATVISCITEALHRTWIRLSNAKGRADDEDQLRIINERLRLAISVAAVGTWDVDVPANITEKAQARGAGVARQRSTISRPFRFRVAWRHVLERKRRGYRCQ